jgi:integrase
MASLHLDSRSKHWCVRFYHEGLRYQHSCCTGNKRKALRVLGAIEETIEDLHNGRRVIPENADPRDWIVSGGKLLSLPSTNGQLALNFGDLCAKYLEDQTRKAESTVNSEKTHIKHLKRILRQSARPSSISLEDLRRYVRIRLSESYRGKPVTLAVRRELATFRQIWVWAQDNNHLSLPCPLLRPTGRWRIELEKPKEKVKFQTWQQIQRRIDRGGLSDEEQSELWESLFLDEGEIGELLAFVKETAAFAFIYPMFVMAAYTGARRSELMRSCIDDIDFSSGQVLIRERKRRKDLSSSYRYVPLHPRLRSVLGEWLTEHPGGQHTLVTPTEIPRRAPVESPQPLTRNQATHHFKQTLAKSKWRVVRGFHVLRHSFGSNLVRTGKVPAEVVGQWMGHTTQEMRAHYQHLFPQDGIHQISVLQ